MLVDQIAGQSFVILASRSTSGALLRGARARDGRDPVPAASTTGACTADSFDPAVGWSDQWR